MKIWREPTEYDFKNKNRNGKGRDSKHAMEQIHTLS
jgi:hypothetical protein